ncbi:endonuclease/exonuclease/phosphatase family protein [Alloalcanivorax xenomutans]|jgi:endonuclease/exonuclease/phosphatase family metal-dependent hydrolase|uniref:Endonuclease/exonuclease/phosphatase family protein n=1 Tax=Alloalcanivorax xenomutans TaxID=1094342 RepID=A0A9Q3W9R0_9GAMM|nr:endonuclease/exonuclease/phosphatase family protein [Alloalcanivorax xenomutans]KYZ85601.1 endonuclease [Alcanivorax sp. KX64203]MBA4719853.1 endonuclease/exonuclease/phosphatase family protein [Alcanivorax sp.]MCE7511072.1 endonuclease/exonuclease/phosphatase family protein [Alloalcanivorax xenomutans]PHS58938.1 MAG: endonuclease [Alcanivorax sp.]WOA31302.1 endonuclease/exonuclease/phosphatase family protein [Alloalcanivorax xenomutans]|tara:strand:+ start:1344 stop:2243 length:900 start_codon:yes stop_codon:yes gene_type:complete
MLLERARNAYQNWKTRPSGFSLAREGHRRTRRVREVSLPSDTLKILSFNIQAGIGTSRFRDYVTGSWKHLVAHPRSVEIIEQIADVVRHFDVVGLQEVDGGSLRSRNLNQLVHLASLADFPFWHQQLNRNLGRLGQFSNGLLSRMPPYAVEDHILPGLPGRGAIVIKFGHPVEPLVVAVCHLALGEKMRNTQLTYLADLLRPYRYSLIMGDFNCRPEHLSASPLTDLGLVLVEGDLQTYPSWAPDRHIDHILATPELQVRHSRVLEDCLLSDHLPLATEIRIPDAVRAASLEHRLPLID